METEKGRKETRGREGVNIHASCAYFMQLQALFGKDARGRGIMLLQTGLSRVFCTNALSHHGWYVYLYLGPTLKTKAPTVLVGRRSFVGTQRGAILKGSLENCWRFVSCGPVLVSPLEVFHSSFF